MGNTVKIFGSRKLYEQLLTKQANREEISKALNEMIRKEAKRTAKGRAERIKKTQAIYDSFEKFTLNTTEDIYKSTMMQLEFEIKTNEKRIAKLDKYKADDPLYFIEGYQTEYVELMCFKEEFASLKTAFENRPVLNWYDEIAQRSKYFTNIVIDHVVRGMSHSSQPCSNLTKNAKFTAYAKMAQSYTGRGWTGFTSTTFSIICVFGPGSDDSEHITYVFDNYWLEHNSDEAVK